MSALGVLFLISFLYLTDLLLKAFGIKTNLVLGCCALVITAFFYKSVLTSKFVDKDLQIAFNHELAEMQDNCDKPIELPSIYRVEFGKTGEAIGYCQK